MPKVFYYITAVSFAAAGLAVYENYYKLPEKPEQVEYAEIAASALAQDCQAVYSLHDIFEGLKIANHDQKLIAAVGDAQASSTCYTIEYLAAQAEYSLNGPNRKRWKGDDFFDGLIGISALLGCSYLAFGYYFGKRLKKQKEENEDFQDTV